MPRPRLPRKVSFYPNSTYFKPAGIPLNVLEHEIINEDEIEAIRLIDHDEVEQKKACKKMNISQPTLSRLLKSGRKKISQALIHGKAIKIYEEEQERTQPKERKNWIGKKINKKGIGRTGTRRGNGRMNGDMPGAGPGGVCICTDPKCKYEENQVRGNPCNIKKCPKCGKPMTRKQ